MKYLEKAGPTLGFIVIGIGVFSVIWNTAEP